MIIDRKINLLFSTYNEDALGLIKPNSYRLKSDSLILFDKKSYDLSYNHKA